MPPAPARPDPDDDPVRARRRQIERWTLLANRIGYLLFAVAIACFVMAFAFGFTVVTVCLIAGSILLAPAIVLGYAVKAAEKDDRARGL
jgi:hypothetical protein